MHKGHQMQDNQTTNTVQLDVTIDHRSISLRMVVLMREKGKDQIDWITNYIYIGNFPTFVTPSYTDLEQQTPTDTANR